MGVGHVWGTLSQGEFILHLARILDAGQQYKAGHNGREEDRNCRVPPRASHFEETEGKTRNTSGRDAHVGSHRFDVRFCGGQA